MDVLKDPFEPVIVDQESGDGFAELNRRSIAFDRSHGTSSVPAASTARIHAFDDEDRPLVIGVDGFHHEVVSARTTIPLLRSQIGASVVLLFENGDVHLPIIVGVLQEGRAIERNGHAPQQLVSVNADDDRLVLSAEREIVLRCGDASITLTRAGKILIKGTHVLSHSSGYNKIKGAAVDIN
jgi:hypothetical protein